MDDAINTQRDETQTEGGAREGAQGESAGDSDKMKAL